MTMVNSGLKGLIRILILGKNNIMSFDLAAIIIGIYVIHVTFADA